MIIADSHAHLYDKKYEEDINIVLMRARSAKIGVIIVPSEDIETAKIALCLSKKHRGLIFPTIGFHPHNIKKFNEDAFKRELSSKSYVGVGEIGLDYFYDKDTKKEQQYILRKQFEITLKFNLPVILHVRDAFSDMFKIIDEFKGLYGVFHSFSSGTEEAKEALKRGFYISFSGIITFKNAKSVQDALKIVPLDRLLVETDSPYLSPMPLRGKRNEPCFIIYIINKIAEILNEPPTTIAHYTYKNTIQLFNLSLGTT